MTPLLAIYTSSHAMNAKTNFQGWTIFPEITGTTEIFHPVEEPYISAVWIILHGGGTTQPCSCFKATPAIEYPTVACQNLQLILIKFMELT